MKIVSSITLIVMATLGVSTAAWADEPDAVYRAWDNYRQHYDSAGHTINPREPAVTGSTASAQTTQPTTPIRRHVMMAHRSQAAIHHAMMHHKSAQTHS